MSKVAMIVGPGYEDTEVMVPYEKLSEAGHEVVILGSQSGDILHGKRGKSRVEVQYSPAEVRPGDFDALVIPGGHGPDRLRLDDAMVEFVRRFHASGKPIAAICHGPQLLIEAEVVKSHTMTSWRSVRKDLVNAGANWVDKEVVEDANFITSRSPDDLGAFCEVLLDRL